jgi:mRNA interferase RelE/StbE
VTYHVVISPAAARQLQERLPEAVARACYEFIRGPLAEEPHRVGAPLRAPFEEHWRARRGEYRVRYTVNEDAKEIHVLGIDHRRCRVCCGARAAPGPFPAPRRRTR